MSTAAGAFLTILILAASAIGAVFYVQFRDQQASQFAHITSMNQTVGAPATVCTYNATQFGNGTGGLMYIRDGHVRIDIKDLEYSGYAANVQAVLGIDGTRKMDADSLDRLSSQSDGAIGVLNLILTRAPWKCSPWWFTDDSEFTLQHGVNF